MVTDILSTLQAKKADFITKPKSPEIKELIDAPRSNISVSIDKSIESSIEEVQKANEDKIKELYNSSELIFTKIVENLQSQVKSKPNVSALIVEYLKNSGNEASKYKAEVKSGIMSNEIFNNSELIKQVITNPNPNNIAQLSTITKAGIEFQLSLSQKIVIIQNLVKIAKENKIIVDLTTINKFFDYYDSVEKAVTTSQKELAIAQEPYNGYTIGYHELVANPVKEITESFRVNPYYNTGDILKSTKEDAEVKEIGFAAERKVNSAMSSVPGVVMVIAGPNFGQLDTVWGVDSLTFSSKNIINENIRKRLVELAYQISYAAYQESLIKDYQEADPKKIRKHEVVPMSYVEAIKNLELAKTGLTVYFNDITLIQQEIKNYDIEIKSHEADIADLKLKKSSKADTGTQNSIEKERKKIKVLTDKIDKLKIEIMTLELIIEDKQKSIETQKLEALTIYTNYNPQGLAVPLALSPQGQIEVYQDGLKIQYKQKGFSDYANPLDIKALEKEFDQLLIQNSIRTNAIQIKQDVNNPRVMQAIGGKYSGAIGLSMDYNSEPTTLKNAIAISLNLDDTVATLSTPLKSTSIVRSR